MYTKKQIAQQKSMLNNFIWKRASNSFGVEVCMRTPISKKKKKYRN